jgi:hypothetical protein
MFKSLPLLYKACCEKKILPVGHQPAGPLNMCLVLFVPALSPFGLRTSSIPAEESLAGSRNRMKTRTSDAW